MWLSLRLFGAAEAAWLRNKTLIIVKSFRIGGKDSGKQLLNFLQKVLYLTTMSITQGTQKVEFSLASLPSGLTL